MNMKIIDSEIQGFMNQWFACEDDSYDEIKEKYDLESMSPLGKPIDLLFNLHTRKAKYVIFEGEKAAPYNNVAVYDEVETMPIPKDGNLVSLVEVVSNNIVNPNLKFDRAIVLTGGFRIERLTELVYVNEKTDREKHFSIDDFLGQYYENNRLGLKTN